VLVVGLIGVNAGVITGPQCRRTTSRDARAASYVRCNGSSAADGETDAPVT
jgi:hypothetical protein